MISREDLETLTSAELHDRAIATAKAHSDVAWFWRLMKAIPAAEASIGDVDDADMDIASTVSALNGFMRADEGELAEALRPMYIDYLLEHL